MTWNQRLVTMAYSCLALGLFLSTTLEAGFHIFLVLALFLNAKAIFKNFKSYPKSAMALFLFSIACIASVLFNQDIMLKGFASVTKVKYYLIASLSILPIHFALKDAPIIKKNLIRVLMFAAVLGSLLGLFALFKGHHLFGGKLACHETRNCGMSGMYMNYAHGLSFLLTLMLASLFDYIVRVYFSGDQQVIATTKKNWREILPLSWLVPIFIFLLFAFYMTFTRGAWLAFLILAPFYFLKNHLKKFLLLGGVCLISAFLVFQLVPKVRETFLNRQLSNDERVGSFKAALYAFSERPILGYGLLNFEPHSSEIKERYGINNAYFKGHAHNNFLEFLATTGAIGFFFFVAFIYFVFQESFTRSDFLARIMPSLMVAFIAGGMTQSTFILADNTFFITGFFALFAALNPRLKYVD